MFVALGPEGLYIVKDLHMTPHGDDNISSLPKNEGIASQNRVSIRKYPAELQRAPSSGLMIFRECSHEILHQSVINLQKDRLVNYVISQVTAQSILRHKSDTYGIDFGFS